MFSPIIVWVLGYWRKGTFITGCRLWRRKSLMGRRGSILERTHNCVQPNTMPCANALQLLQLIVWTELQDSESSIYLLTNFNKWTCGLRQRILLFHCRLSSVFFLSHFHALQLLQLIVWRVLQDSTRFSKQFILQYAIYMDDREIIMHRIILYLLAILLHHCLCYY